MTEPLFSPAEIQRTIRSLQFLSSDVQGEVPFRIHESGHDTHFGLGSSPPFAPEFIGWIGALTCKNEYCSRCRKRTVAQPRDNDAGRDATRTRNHRARATKAFRKLRKHAPIEYDVLWMATMYHLTVAQITTNLNDRAITRGYPERYREADVVVLIVAGTDKVSRWF